MVGRPHRSVAAFPLARMRKRNLFVLAAAFVVGGGAFWTCFHHEARVSSTLSRRDAADIKRLMWELTGGNRSPTFTLSPHGILSLPHLVQDRLHYRPGRLLSIEADAEGVRAEATLRVPRDVKVTYGVTCKLRRAANAWTIASSRVWIGP